MAVKLLFTQRDSPDEPFRPNVSRLADSQNGSGLRRGGERVTSPSPHVNNKHGLTGNAMPVFPVAVHFVPGGFEGIDGV